MNGSLGDEVNFPGLGGKKLFTDFKSIVNAGADNVDWWIVELDRCATDMMEAVVRSYNFMVDGGYASGR